MPSTSLKTHLRTSGRNQAQKSRTSTSNVTPSASAPLIEPIHTACLRDQAATSLRLARNQSNTSSCCRDTVATVVLGLLGKVHPLRHRISVPQHIAQQAAHAHRQAKQGDAGASLETSKVRFNKHQSSEFSRKGRRGNQTQRKSQVQLARNDGGRGLL